MRFASCAPLVFLLAACASTEPNWKFASGLSCAANREPADFCASFHASPSLQHDPDAERARAHCLAFYQEAIHSSHLLCSYFVELDRLNQASEGLDSPTLSAKGKALDRWYAQRARERAAALEHAYRQGGKSISVPFEFDSYAYRRGVKVPELPPPAAAAELAQAGRDLLHAELDCRPTPGHSTSFLLLGVSQQVAEDEALTFDRLQDGLSLLAQGTRLESVRPLLALRRSLEIQHGVSVADRANGMLKGRALDVPALLALGYTEAPAVPGVERHYAEAVRRSRPGVDPYARGGAERGLASVTCPAFDVDLDRHHLEALPFSPPR